MARPRKAAVEDTEDTTATTTEHKDGETDDPDPDDGAGDPDDDGLESRIRTIVRDVVGTMVGGSGGNGHRQVNEEDQITHRVRSEMDKLRAEEARDQRFKAIEEQVEKVMERPPDRPGILGKVQRVMWGEAET